MIVTYGVNIDVREDDAWTALWHGEWRVPPAIGMTFEVRIFAESVKWYRVIAVHVVIFSDEGYSGSCTVYAEEIDAMEVAPKG